MTYLLSHRTLRAMWQGLGPVLVLGLSLLTVGWWYHSLRTDATAMAQEKLHHKAGEFTLKLSERMRAYEQVLWGAAALFEAKKQVSRTDWHAYIERLALHERYPGILAIGYAESFPASQLESRVRSVRAEGFPAYSVRPTDERAQYTSIVYVEPFAGLNLRAFGYDMFAEPVRRDAMERARDSGRAAISHRLPLLQDDPTKPKAGLLFYVPVYSAGASIATVAGRRQALQGYVYIAYFAADLVSGMVGPDMDGVDVKVYDTDGRSEPALLFDSNGMADQSAAETYLRASETVEVGGQRWQVEYAQSALADAGESSPRLVLALGSATSLLLFGVVLTMARTKNRALALARQMTAELRAKQAELEAVNDNSPIGIFRTSRDGAAVYINRQCALICDMSAVEMQQFGWAQRLHADDRERVLCGWKAFLQDADRYEGEHRFVHRDGRVVWARVKAAPIREAGTLLGFTGSLEDVSASREHNFELERSRGFLDAILDAVPQPIWVKDRQHRWVLVNESFTALRGRSRPQLMGKSNFDVFSPEVAAIHWAEDDQALAQPQPLIVEESVTTSDGQAHWMVKTMRGVTLSDGSAYVVGVATDITARKQMEEALRASQSRLRLVNAIGAQITSGLAIDDIVRAAVLGMAEMLPGLRAGYALVDSQGVMRMLYSEGPPDTASLMGVHVDLNCAPTYLRDVRADVPVIVCDVLSDTRLELLGVAAGTRFGAFIAVPVHHDAEDIGLLGVAAELPRNWTGHEVETVHEVAEAVGVALRNAHADSNRRQAERELRDSQERLQIALWASDVGLWSWDPINDEAFFTVEWKRQLGYEDDEIPNATASWGDRLHPDDREAVHARIRDILVDPALPFELEFRLQHKDRSYRWILSRAKAERDDQGQVLRVTGAHIDITERKEAELAAQRSRQFLDLVINAIPQPFWVKDYEHRWLMVNRAFASMHGREPTFFIGKSDFEVFPTGAAQIYAQDDQAFSAGGSVFFEEAVDVPRLERRWIIKSKTAVSLDDGRRYLVGIAVDITQRKEAELEAERSRKFLDGLMNALPHGVFVKDAQHRWVTMNDAFAAVLQRPKSELLFKSDFDVFAPEYAARAWAHDDEAMRSRTPVLVEEPVQLDGGRVGWFNKTKVSVELGEGERYVVGVSVDVTAHKEAQLEAERNRAFLEAVFDTMPQGVFVKDEQGRWLMVNEATCRMLGVQREDLIGKVPGQALPSEFAAMIVEQDRQAFAADGPLMFEQQPRIVEGRELWLMKTVSIVRLSDGSRYLVGVNTDITELKQTGRDAERNRQFLDNLINALPTPIFVKDKEHRWVHINDAFCKLYGVRREDLLGKDDAHLLDSSTATDRFREDDHVLQTKSPLVVEQWQPLPDGSGMWGVKTKTPVLFADGSGGIVGMFVDITERKLAELEAIRARQFLDALIDAVPTTVFVKDRQHRWVVMNQAALNFLGATREQVIGHTDFDLFPKEQAEQFWIQDDAAMDSEHPLEYEEPFVTARRETRWVLKSKRRVVLADGTRYLIGSIADITERRRSALAVENAQKFLNALINAVPHPIFVKDRKHRFVLVNDACCELNGMTREQMLRQPDHQLVPGHEADMFQRQDELVFETRQANVNEEQFTDPHGRKLSVVTRKALFRDSEDRDVLVGVITDITERVQAQEELRRHRDNLQQLVQERTRELMLAKNAAEQANRAKSDFLANMSHELRTPMHAILSYARLGLDKIALDELPKHKVQQYFGRIDQGGERLLKLLDDLLDLSKLEAGKMVYRMARTNLEEIARSTLMQFEGMARASAVTLMLDRPTEDVSAWCDPDRIGQVLANLLSNAIKFSPSGGVVSVRLASTHGAAGSARSLEISVTDQGVGIPQAELESIFDKFVQSSQTKTGSGGTGLGLSICKEIVQDHGGRIWAQRSEGDGGSVMRFILPREPIHRPGTLLTSALSEVL